MVTVFGDPQSELADIVRAALADRTEPYASGVEVGTRTPTGRDPNASPPPLVVVAQDGPGTIQHRANTRVTIRVAVFHQTDDDAYDLAQLVQGVVLAYAGPVVRSVRPGLSPTRATDPDTGEPMAWFTVTANVSPRNL